MGHNPVCVCGVFIIVHNQNEAFNITQKVGGCQLDYLQSNSVVVSIYVYLDSTDRTKEQVFIPTTTVMLT